MKALQIGVLVGSFFIESLAIAETESERKAEILLSTIGVEEAMAQSMSQMLDLQLQQNPTLAPFRSVMMAFLEKHMSYESVKPELIRIYSEAFTEQELNEINNFYATNTGKKVIQLIPTLTIQGGQIAASRVQENIGELQAMIQAESDRLVELSEQ